MFTHLHVHTEYSLLDGMCRIPELVARAKELGMNSLAITDHGVMYGAIQFYLAAKDAGIKPIIGCEVYIAPNGQNANGKGHYHLVLLAKNQTGYRNLVQLETKAHLEGFYYKPRIDKGWFKEHCEGLVALSACIAGEVPQLILGGQRDDARKTALWYKETFENFYFEIQRHPIPELERINQGLIALGKELDIPLVATNDVHYINQRDASTHDLLLCIGTNSTVNDEKRMKMAGDFFYLKSPQEMQEVYQDIPEALENTAGIAEMCNLKIDFGRLHLPEPGVPEGKDADQYLTDLCYEGLDRFYPHATPEIKQRLEYELDVIKKTQFANYFLVVWDIVSFVRNNNIFFGVRGSAAASIVLHCLNITEIDPMENTLVFERFLNVERKEMPDIDLDFEDDRREEVIAYVTQKYGQDHVAQIITFGTLGARAALRDVGRALGMAYGEVDQVVRLVPYALNMTLERAMKENNDLKSIYDQDASVRKLVDSARRVEGLARHASTHAAGVVISKESLTRHVPLQRVSRESAVATAMTQFVMEDIAKIGLLKMDFLGLANLTILRKAKEMVLQNQGVDIDLHHIPMNDKKTFALLSSGETAGVFQLEGAGMRRYIKDLKPNTFTDIAAMVALYRPGPMEHIPTFIKAKHGLEPIRYPHPALASILEQTYGVIVYQEQVLFIVRTVAGYSLGQADIFRKAMGKKIAEVMKKEKVTFVNGAAQKGFTPEITEQIYALIEPFAGYAFNKAHAYSYALIAYQTAYLKANYPAEYITALLIGYSSQPEKVATAAAECRRLDIDILPPNINRSQPTFSIEKVDGRSCIRWGLAAIKNVGVGAMEAIVAERNKSGEFKSLDDLCRRCDLRGLNRRVMESLVKAGALDCLGERGTLLHNITSVLSLAQREQRLLETGQSNMFNLFGQTVPVPSPDLDWEQVEVTVKEKAEWEKELIGVSISKQPFSPDKEDIGTTPGEINAEMDGQNVVVIGEVSGVTQLFTRKQEPFVKATLGDITGSVEMMVWPRIYQNTKDLWQDGTAVRIEGKVRLRDDQVQLNCDTAELYQPGKNRKTEPVTVAVAPKVSEPLPIVEEAPPPPPTTKKPQLIITLTQSSDHEADKTLIHKLDDIIREFPGDYEVIVRVNIEDRITPMRWPSATNNSRELQQRLAVLVGENALVVES